MLNANAKDMVKGIRYERRSKVCCMKRNPTIPQRVTITIHFLMCCICIMAQDIDLDMALKDVYRDSWSLKAADFDDSKKEKILSLVTNQNYEGLSDSAKYIFHKFSADLFYDKEDIENEKIHIDKAVKLSESSVGILNPEYISLLMEQGCLTDDIDKAIGIYQKAIIVSQTLLYYPKAQDFPFRLITDTYGNLMNFLAELYDKKGWTTRIEELYRTAFRFRSYYNAKNDPHAYGDLYGLSNYYERKGEINKSIELLELVLNDINENGYYASNAYVDALYMLGSAYSKGNQEEKSINAYRSAVKLIRDSLEGNSETLYNLYKNYCVKLAELNHFEELDNNLPNVQQYYTNIDSINRYADMLFLIIDKSVSNQRYDYADKYCDSLLLYPSYHIGYEEVIYSKKALTSYMCNKPEVALQWQNKALKYCFDHNGENSVIYSNYLADLAFLFKQNSMKEESLTAYLHLVKLLEKNNRDTISYYNQKITEICELYNSDQKYDLEYQFLKSRKQNISEKYGKDNLIYAWICNFLSVIEINIGKLEESKENNLNALKIYSKLEGENSYNYAIALHNKGRLFMLEGKYKQALDMLLRSRRIQVEAHGKIAPNTEKYIQEIETKL